MQVVSASDAKVKELAGGDGVRTRIVLYFGENTVQSDGPQGYLVDKTLTVDTIDADQVMVVPAHYHRVRQFQLVVSGSAARIGKHDTPPFSFHYIDPSSPYGPIFAGADGIAFFTLRPKGDVAAYFMPGAKDRMRGRAHRNVVVNAPPKAPPAQGVESEELIERQEDGLAAFRLRLGPDESAIGPEPADTGGQYLYVAAGSLKHGGQVVDGSCLAWIGPEDDAPELRAGSEGADVLVLQFPIVTTDETIDLNELDPKVRERLEKQKGSVER